MSPRYQRPVPNRYEVRNHSGLVCVVFNTRVILHAPKKAAGARLMMGWIADVGNEFGIPPDVLQGMATGGEI